MNCIICGSENLVETFIHSYWQKPLHTCTNCDHTHLYDYDNVDDNIYSANQYRAQKYVQMLNKVPVNTVLEIGPASDMWFSMKMEKSMYEVEYTVYDVADITPPSHIKKIDILEGKFDLVIAIHVLEHIPDARGFAELVSSMGKYFVIEVPNCDDTEAHKVRTNKVRTTNQGHYHAFSKKSFDLTFEGIDCKLISRASGTHSGGLPFVAYRLPKGFDIK